MARLLDHMNRQLTLAVARRGGRVVRLKGDGGLIEFASAVDALAGAIDFQQAMVEANRGQPEDQATIVFRVDLHLGDVIVDGDDIYGDDVNVAARLETERYGLEGSVQRGGSRTRVNVQLIDTGTGGYLWAERFDKPVGDLLDMQDEIVARLVRHLGTQLIGAEARRAERAPNLDSVDLHFQGMAWLNKGNTPDCLSQARSYFERSLTLDPVKITYAEFADGMEALWKRKHEERLALQELAGIA